ncbi:hypothetical protein GOBAR_DD31769 [Gossypium barbadense]|nr:hypothetical protein GOBAR_DD31769 [Gossypium barbadense]
METLGAAPPPRMTSSGTARPTEVVNPSRQYAFFEIPSAVYNPSITRTSLSQPHLFTTTSTVNNSHAMVVDSDDILTIIELALGLEASNRPFIWVVRKGYKSDEFNKWLSEEGFEERNKGRGLLIHGWAPQLSILSHTFMNEKLVVQVLGIGERVGADIAMKWGEEEPYGVMVKREEITKTINLVMDSGNEGEERRKRAMKLQVLANKAFENKGSSCLNVKRLIKDISQISGTKD